MPLRLLLAFPSHCPRSAILAAALVFLILFPAAAPSASAQNPSDQPGDEVIANLAAGRVILAVVKDAIIIATIENPIEAQTHPPTPVPLSAQRAGVILGAVDWFSPTSQAELARLERELPHLRGHVRVAAPQAPSLQHGEEGNEAYDIETIGQGLQDRLNQLVKDLHAKMDLPEGEPIAELVVAGYVPGYGPDIWHMAYSLEQFPMHGDYWETRVKRPIYLQDWPPDKDQPHTLIEFHYPPSDPSPSLLDMLKKKDPRLEKLSSSDAAMQSAASMFLSGTSNKIPSADATQFLRAALNIIAPPNARQTMAIIIFETGFAWILPPPSEPKKPAEQKDRPADAPSLIKPSSK